MPVPLAIEVHAVSKSFQIPAPDQSLVSRLRAGTPFRAAPGRSLDVLRDIGFEVTRGEFFGIVGRNGSGKSTLLKALAGVYGVDEGSIRVAGRVAPFLELGLGFSPDLPAAENVVMNAVMMGLTSREARLRTDEIIDFAGLRDYTDLKLNNYSSGMRVRLGFAVMTHVDADVLLVDEVLAVGDAEFAGKCEEVFDRMHAEGRTIILVTHAMDAVNAYCDRAMVLHEGRVDAIGDPATVARRYVELNAEAAAVTHADTPGIVERLSAALLNPSIEVTDACLVGADGDPTDSLSPGEPIELRARLSFRRDLNRPTLILKLTGPRQDLIAQRAEDVIAEAGAAGDVLDLRVSLDNHLAGGRYLLDLRFAEGHEDGILRPVSPAMILRFDVQGERDAGHIALAPTVRVEPVRAGGPIR